MLKITGSRHLSSRLVRRKADEEELSVISNRLSVKLARGALATRGERAARPLLALETHGQAGRAPLLPTTDNSPHVNRQSSIPKKLSFKETRELEGMEAQIHALEAEVTRIEGLFADPEFFRKPAAQIHELTAALDAAKEKVPQLYARWEELEARRTAAA